MELLFDTLECPIGTIILVSRGSNLCAVDFSDYESRLRTLLERRYPGYSLHRQPDPNGFTHCLRRYFDGNAAAFDSVEVETGGTLFQQSVWLALREIPLGTTVSYGELAIRIGRPSTARAVGYANSLNPVGIVLPCHRVIGRNGDLTGYAGGMHRKQWLLEHERAMVVAGRSATYGTNCETNPRALNVSLRLAP
jgi:methylated-DNA-[protein]-cysteine S-methyltransferase